MKKIALFMFLLTAHNICFAQSTCTDGHMALTHDREARGIGGPVLGPGGAQWFYKLFEVRRLYSFCATFPVKAIGRDPKYNKKIHDNLVIRVIPPPVVPGTNIFMAVIDPHGRKFTEYAQSTDSWRYLTLKYRLKGTYIFEFMILDEVGWNQYGMTDFSIRIEEIYNGFKLSPDSSLRIPVDYYPPEAIPFINK